VLVLPSENECFHLIWPSSRFYQGRIPTESKNMAEKQPDTSHRCHNFVKL